ncbi:unnamed protein product [Ilex paraguariensis]|uniref:Uncharacterized protein n=1 Tax=Ilex paraguariensis TaxID=185542 RepID=A0ABC8R8Q9_9AQUA
MGKKSNLTRDRDRDISEKVTLGMASTGVGRGGEVMYDQSVQPIEGNGFRAFSGTSDSDKAGPRDRPVEFEREAEEADPFGLYQFLTEVKKGKKAMDKVDSGVTMKAIAGSSMRDLVELVLPLKAGVKKLCQLRSWFDPLIYQCLCFSICAG